MNVNSSRQAPGEPDTPRVCPSCGAELSRSAARFCGSCGASLALQQEAAVPVPPASATATWSPGSALVHVPKPDGDDGDDLGERWWTGRKILIASVATVVVLGVVATFLLRQSTGSRSPEGPVLAFFDALARHDGAAAGALLSEAGGDSPLFTAGALETGYEAPNRVAVDAVEHFVDDGAGKGFFSKEGIEKRPNMDYAGVTVTYMVGTQHVTQKWGLQRETEGIERDYTIVNVDMGYLSVGIETDNVHVAGIVSSGKHQAPPGVYDVALVDHPLWADVEGQVPVVAGRSSTDDDELPKTVTLSVRPELAETVSQQINAAIDDCAVDGALSLETCPYSMAEPSLESFYEGDSEWKIDSYPTIALLLDRGELIVEVTGTGSATGKYTGDSQVRVPSPATAELNPTGTVSLDESGDITWTYVPDT